MAVAHWYWMKDGQKRGPVDTAGLKQLAKTGQLLPTDMIWREGLAKWVPADRAKGLFDEAHSIPAVAQAPGDSSPPGPSLAEHPKPIQAPAVLPILRALRAGLLTLASFHLLILLGGIAELAVASGPQNATARLAQSLQVIFLLFYTATTVMLFVGASSVRRNGTAWKPILVVFLVLLLGNLSVLAYCTQAVGDRWLLIPAWILHAFLATSFALALSGTILAWIRSGRSDTAGRKGIPVPNLVGAGAAVAIEVLAIVVGFALLHGAREEARSILCKAKLRFIGNVVHLYVNDNDDRAPQSLAEKSLYLPYKSLSCDRGPHEARYVYLLDYLKDAYRQKHGVPAQGIAGHQVDLRANLKFSDLRDPSVTPLAWEAEPRHGNSRLVNVVFADGPVYSISPEKLHELLDNAEADLNRWVR